MASDDAYYAVVLVVGALQPGPMPYKHQARRFSCGTSASPTLA